MDWIQLYTYQIIILETFHLINLITHSTLCNYILKLVENPDPPFHPWYPQIHG